MKRLKPLVMALALSGIAMQANAKPLAGELQQLLERHPLIKSSQKLVEAAEKGQDAARAGYLPKVSLYGDTGREHIESRGYAPVVSGSELKIGGNNATNPNTVSDLTRSKIGVTVEQNLFSGMRTAANVDIANLDHQLRQSELRNTVQNTLLEGLTAYLQLARLKSLLAVAELNEATTQRQTRLEGDRVEKGGGIAVDVLQARTRLQLARERKVFVEQNMRDAIANYHQVFGHAPDLNAIEDVLTLDARLPATLQQALEMAMKANSSVAESILQSRRAQRQIGLEKSTFYPSVDLVGFYGSDKNVNQIESRKEASALFKLNWNLFSGNETRSRSEAALKVYESTVDREAAVIRKVEENVRTAWNQLENGRERQELLKNASGIASEVMIFRKRLRDSGKETAINVLDAEVEYYSVLSNRINAEYDSRISFYRLLYVTGQLTPELLGVGGDGKLRVPTRPLSKSLEAYQIKTGLSSEEAKTTAAVTPRDDSAKTDGDVRAALNQWASAWAAKDVNAFIAAHTADFAPPGMTRAKWEKERAQRINGASWIKVVLDDVKVEMKPDGRALVRFKQSYSSDRLSDVTFKTFELVQQDGTWKIASQL